jgi:hypothetical protein
VDRQRTAWLPGRLYNPPIAIDGVGKQETILRCLYTRHHDGFVRQLWTAIGICPLAASRRCPPTAISSRSVLAAGDTTDLPVPPSTGTSGTLRRIGKPSPGRDLHLLALADVQRCPAREGHEREVDSQYGISICFVGASPTASRT